MSQILRVSKLIMPSQDLEQIIRVDTTDVFVECAFGHAHLKHLLGEQDF